METGRAFWKRVSICVLFTLMCNGLLRGYVRDVPADPNSDPNTASAGALTASLDNPNAAYLIFDAGDGSIVDAMQNIGALNVRVRSDSNPVTTQDWDWCDIVIIGANSGSDTITGLDTEDIGSRITGRVILSGHDADLHASDSYSGDPQRAAQMFLIQSINYAIEGAGKGLIGFGDASAAFDWAPESWELVCTKGFSEETVASFTEDGLDSGIYNDLTLSLMSNWAVSYHVRFDSYSQGFFPFETGYFNGQEGVVTIGCPVNPMGVELYKYDDIADGNCVNIDDAFEYTIEWHNTTEQTFYEVYLKDVFPVGVDYPVTYTFDPNTFTMVSSDPGYDGATHTYIYPIGTLAPDDSDSIQLTVTVNENAVPGMYLHNVAELWATIYDANGLNPVERLIATAYEDTLACCWDTSGILYVDKNAPAGGNGTSWELAYNDLQDALTRARETECTFDYVIYVAQGIYKPDETPEEGFMLPEGVSVYGGFPSGGCEFSERNPKRYETILTGLIDEDEFPDAIKVVTMGDETLLDGLTVANGLEYGIYGEGADFTLANCIIKENDRYGIYAENGNVAVQWCMINSNGTTGIQHTGEGYSLTVDNSWIMRNGEYGVYCDGSTPTCRNNIISESDLSLQGRAGIRLYRPSYQPALHNNTIANNKAVGILFEDNGDITGDPNSLDYPDLQNSIVYYNGGNQVSGFNPDTVANFCCIQDCNTLGTTNFNAEPGFAYTVDSNGVPDPNNYHLAYDAFCKDKANPFLTYTGQVDIDGEGLDRQYGVAVDIGADEVYDCDDDYLSEIDVHNAMDLNADGIVNLNEFRLFSAAWLTYDPNHPLCDPNNLNYVSDPNLSGYIDQNDKLRFNPTCDLNSDLHVGLADFVLFCDDWLWVACWKLDELNAAGASAQTESLMAQSFSASRSLLAVALDATAETVESQPEISVETLVQIISFLNEAEIEMPDNLDAIEAVRAILVEQLGAIVSKEEQ
ncbi:MAG: right-handed parallel beta-helix repeat-containing protein [Sedimentisphaerales bacterium]|nr:right-handed parallel beta-helix repeat-containing protein [Sedimentisphaerales bacterium]